jgi:hypothetical protein
MNETREKALAEFLTYRLGKKAVRRIQSVADREMYYEVTEAALFMATAGFLDEGNQLLHCLWKHKWPHLEDCWLPDQSFEVLWHAKGERPLNVPFEKKPIEVIELAHRRYMTRDGYDYLSHLPMPDVASQELHGLDLLRRSCRLACPPREEQKLPSSNQEMEALEGLARHVVESGDADAHHGGRTIVLAAELAARNELADQAVAHAQLWAAYCPERWLGYNFPIMASNRHVAPLLLKGILAEPFGLTKPVCQTYFKSLVAAVEARMKRGRKLVYGKWTWERLLTAASKRAIKAQGALFTPEQRKGKWLGSPAASDVAIAATEARLHCQLPTDYLEFLRVSNGLPALSATTARLREVERVGHLVTETSTDLVAILKEHHEDDALASFDRSIQISDLGEMGGELVLLIPPASPDDPWQTWFYAPWVPGVIRYPSFRHFLEQTFQELLPE